MLGRIVEIAENGRYLSLYRGFLLVNARSGEGEELGRIPLDDIAVVIANAHGLSYSNNLLVALAERGLPFVLCGTNHHPLGLLMPLGSNFQQGKRFDAQIAASKPVQKRIWAALVQSKISQQARVLAATGVSTPLLTALAGRVRSGDPDNKEAQAARVYWPLLFGEQFRRDRQATGINTLLNYGYMVLRGMTARAVVAAGLHPTLGVHHCHEANPMRLVDDLMEPFRPVVDQAVLALVRQGMATLTPPSKQALVRSLYADLPTDAGQTPVCVCVQRLATSVAQIYLGQRQQLDLPVIVP